MAFYDKIQKFMISKKIMTRTSAVNCSILTVSVTLQCAQFVPAPFRVGHAARVSKPQLHDGKVLFVVQITVVHFQILDLRVAVTAGLFLLARTCRKGKMGDEKSVVHWINVNVYDGGTRRVFTTRMDGSSCQRCVSVYY